MDDIQKDYKIQAEYFRRNYLPYMPENKDARILDLGCGMGHFLYFAEKMQYTNVLGCDSSMECIRFCRKRGLRVIRDNIFNLIREKENYWDVIIFNDVIEHLYKDEIIEILDRMHAALKWGGVALIKTPNMANPWVSTAGRYICLDHEIGFTEHSMEQALMVCGFKNIKITGTDVYVFRGPLNYMARLCAGLGEKLWYLLSCLYGRNSLKIFAKDLLAAAYKEKQGEHISNQL